MPREKEDYRAIYSNLLEYFDGKRVLNNTEVSRYLKIGRQTCASRYGITKDGIAIEKLARLLAN